MVSSVVVTDVTFKFAYREHNRDPDIQSMCTVPVAPLALHSHKTATPPYNNKNGHLRSDAQNISGWAYGGSRICMQKEKEKLFHSTWRTMSVGSPIGMSHRSLALSL